MLQQKPAGNLHDPAAASSSLHVVCAGFSYNISVSTKDCIYSVQYLLLVSSTKLLCSVIIATLTWTFDALPLKPRLQFFHICGRGEITLPIDRTTTYWSSKRV